MYCLPGRPWWLSADPGEAFEEGLPKGTGLLDDCG